MPQVYHPPKLLKGPSLSFFGAFGVAGLIFASIPFTQFLSKLTDTKQAVEVQDISIPPPPPPPPEPPQEEEPEVEEQKPELQQETPPLDLSQLDVALNPGVGDALSLGFSLDSFNMQPNTTELMQIFELSDLDEVPRRLSVVQPVYPFQYKRDGIEGEVRLIVLINEQGNVESATVESSSHRAFEQPAIEAVLKWKFTAPTKNGKPVRAKYIQPIPFRLRR